MAEFLKTGNEDVLRRAASVKEPHMAALPPLLNYSFSPIAMRGSLRQNEVQRMAYYSMS